MDYTGADVVMQRRLASYRLTELLEGGGRCQAQVCDLIDERDYVDAPRKILGIRD